MCNLDIRLACNKHSVKLWQVAEAIGITDCHFSRQLRKELPDKEKEMILEIIDALAAGKEVVQPFSCDDSCDDCEDAKQKLARRLKYLLIVNRVSREKLAGFLHVSAQAVSLWANGRNCPSLDCLCGIADFFNTTVDYLLGR